MQVFTIFLMNFDYKNHILWNLNFHSENFLFHVFVMKIMIIVRFCLSVVHTHESE